MPGAAGPGDRADAGRQRVQPPEQRPEPAEAARPADRLPALPARHRAGPLGHQHRPAVQGRDRLVGRAALGRELARGHVPQDRGVARHRLGRPAGGEPPRHPVRAVGPADPPHADVEVGHRGHVDPVARLQVRAQALAGLARHRRAEADQVAVRVDVRALAQLVRGVADAAGQPADAGPGPFVVERVGVGDVQVGGADVLVVGLAARALCRATGAGSPRPDRRTRSRRPRCRAARRSRAMRSALARAAGREPGRPG